MSDATTLTPALLAVRSKLSPEDTQAIITAFIRLLMASAYATALFPKKGGDAVGKAASAMSAFVDPHLINGAALSLLCVLGNSSKAETISDAMGGFAAELKTLLEASPAEALRRIESVITELTPAADAS